MSLYFHGTTIDHLKEILDLGIKTRYGRATFTKNPVYTFAYSGQENILEQGLLLTIQDKENKIRKSVDCEIVLDRDAKIISGWVNRFRTEQFGCFPEKKEENVILPTDLIVAGHVYNKRLVELLRDIVLIIKSGEINKDIISLWQKELSALYDNEKLKVMNMLVTPEFMASETIQGMIISVSLREIREYYLGRLVLNGWTIKNNGDHPVNIKTSIIEIEKSEEGIRKLLRNDFIPNQVREEAKLFHVEI